VSTAKYVEDHETELTQQTNSRCLGPSHLSQSQHTERDTMCHQAQKAHQLLCNPPAAVMCGVTLHAIYKCANKQCIPGIQPSPASHTEASTL
jgi:hypothetical protein